MNREIILDIETTGLRPEQGHKIIEICAKEVVNGIKTGNVFHEFINPERDVPFEAFAIHGISTEFLQDKNVFANIAPKFVEFIKDAKLVIHNAKFDVNFLNYELKALKHPLIDFVNVIDTLIIARKKFPGSPASLDALCKRFKISLAKREKHGAFVDVDLLYEVYKCLIDDRMLIKEENYKKDSDIFTVNGQQEKTFRPPREFNNSNEELVMHKEFLRKIKEPIWNQWGD